VGDKVVERRLRRQLGDVLHQWFAAQIEAQEQLRKLLKSPLPLGTLSDLFSFALPLEAGIKQELLEEVHVGRRVKRLLQQLEEQQSAPSSESSESSESSGRSFPPGFSIN
jgi:hypothetical protein